MAGRPGELPLLEIAEVDLRVIYSYLFTGQIRAHQIAITSPVVRLARIGPNELSISDIIQRFAGDEKKPADAGDASRSSPTSSWSRTASVLFEDRAVTPPRAFEMKDLTINLRDVTTKLHAGQGTGTIAFVLNGTPVAVVARDVRVRPAHLKAQINVVDFDVDEVWAYVPLEGAPVRPSGGRFSTSIDLVYDATAGIAVDVETTRGRSDRDARGPGRAAPVAARGEAGGARARRQRRARSPSGGWTWTPTRRSWTRASRRRGATTSATSASSWRTSPIPPGPPANVQLSMGLPEGATPGRARDRHARAPRCELHRHPRQRRPLARQSVHPARLADHRRPGSGRRRRSRWRSPRARWSAWMARSSPDTSSSCAARRSRSSSIPRSCAKIADLTWQAGTAAMQRLTVEGPATIVDGSVTPPQRAEFTTLSCRWTTPRGRCSARCA